MGKRIRAFNRMPDAELIVMQGIWDAQKKGFEKVRASYLIEANPDTVGKQKLTTVLTLLTRLVDRGYVSIEKVGRSNIYSAAITEEEYCKQATKDFVATVCRESAGNLFAALVDGSMIADGDIEELRELMNNEDN